VLDAVVSFWTKSTPKHPENIRAIRDGFLEYDIYKLVRNPTW
jgi:hypothetical protein